jgi:hypothetical protein
MDPFIEKAETWRDFHHNLASQIQRRLNPYLRPRYYAAVEVAITYESVEVAAPRRGLPDVSVWQRRDAESQGSLAVTLAPAPVEAQVPLDDPVKTFAIEIRTVGNHVLVTSIELLSPVNKQPHHEALEAYRRKRRALLNSEAHLMEVDLLRGGERPPLLGAVPTAHYYVTLSRAERRPVAEIWPLTVRDPLPVVPIPLKAPDPDVPLDLGAAVTAVYDDGAYEVRLDYSNPVPPPVLSVEDARWVEELLKSAGTRPS